MTHIDDLIEQVHAGIWTGGPEQVDLNEMSPLELDQQIHDLLLGLEPLASPTTAATVSEQVHARIDGLGPLHDLAADPEISEIMVNSDGWVWIERSGTMSRTDRQLEAQTTMHLIRRLAARAGRTIDLRHPSVDARLLDGSRLHAVIPPLAVDGPCVTIRRFAPRSIELHELGNSAAVALLREAVEAAQTIVIAGATSSGKTTLLNALAGQLDDDMRIITIEDAAELRLPGRHVIRLETRHATESTSAVSLRELARHALRMRPDRIICGEMRGAEALDLIQAMNTGHDGSLSTVHANSPADALRRIETMMLLGQADLPLRAIREQLESCIDLIVMMGRVPGGGRMVTEIASVGLGASGEWESTLLVSNAAELRVLA